MTHRFALLCCTSLLALALVAPLPSRASTDDGAAITSGPKPDGDDKDDDDGTRHRKRKDKKETTNKPPEDEDEPEYHRRFLLGFKGGPALGLTPGYTSWTYGGGYFVEIVVHHDWLDIEISHRFYGGHGTLVMPIEVLFKKPFHVSDVVQLYLGIGPALSLNIYQGSASAHMGLSGVFGAYFWASDHFGFVVEAGYSPYFTHPVSHEILWSGGIVLGW